jgi:2,4-dienoyl-CoA reductase-like NADH-dependent reductase (Old Yellow Enzyme family)
MSTAQLFTPMRVGGLELANRIIIAPMCQYSGHDGSMTDWHLIHLGQLALSGAALLTIEATAVLPEGRITYADVGLYSDETETAVAHILDGVRRWSNMPIGTNWPMLVGRLPRKSLGWEGRRSLLASQTAGWKQ